MRKRLIRWGLVVLAATALAVPVAPSQPSLLVQPAVAHESSAGIACSSEAQVAFHVTAAGNLYEATSVTCVGKYNEISPDLWTVEGIARIRCYRNAQPWDGCRGNGDIISQWRLEGSSEWNQEAAHVSPYTVPAGTSWPCSGESCWFSVSERFESPHDLDNTQDVHRGKNAGNSIRFLLADGTNVVKAATDQWSQSCQCAN